jgi:large subunit ribosomal protein L5
MPTDTAYKHVTKEHASPEAAKLAAHFDKVIVQVGVGRAGNLANFEDKFLPQVVRDIAAITGQQPRTTAAKKSIAGFKVREGQVVGVQVTLRGRKMVDFLTRFTRIVLPRVRDFAGVPAKKVDQGGTLNVGVKEQYVFPEINPERSQNAFSLGITAVPKVKDREATLALLTELEFPFAK